MMLSARLTLAGLAAGCGLALAACFIDYEGLTSGGTSSSGATTSSASSSASTTGSGGAGGSDATTTTTATTTSASSSAGMGGGGSDPCPASVLACSSSCSCSNGVCTPTQVAADAQAMGASALAASADGLAWANQTSGDIMFIPQHSTIPSVLAQKVDTPTAIAAAAGRVIFTSKTTLWMCPVPGCNGGTPIALASAKSLGSLQAVAYNGDRVYWLDRGDDPTGTNKGWVLSCAPDSCSSTTTSMSQNQWVPGGLFLATDSIWWTTLGTGNNNGSVVKRPISTSATGDGMAVASSLIFPMNIAVSGNNTFWTEGKMNGRVLFCPSSGTCQSPLNVAPNYAVAQQPNDIAVSSSRVYWTDDVTNTIFSCPVTGCTGGVMPRTDASRPSYVHHIAIYSNCLFWTEDTNGGRVLKIPRSPR